jgi:hypothetical protein
MTVAPLNTFGTRAVWEWVAMIGAQSFTGELRLTTHPEIAIYAVRGETFWAELATDPALTERLISVGAVQPDQIDRGAIRLGTVVNLSRMFDRDPSIDRHVAEVAVEFMRDDLLERLADTPAEVASVAPLRMHPSGVHRWFASTATPAVNNPTMAADNPAPTAVVETTAATPEPAVNAPVAAPVERAVLKPIHFDFDRAFAPLSELATAQPTVRLEQRVTPEPTLMDATPTHQIPVFTAAPIPLTAPVAASALTELWSLADAAISTDDQQRDITGAALPGHNKDTSHG